MVISYEEIINKNYSLNAEQYFEVKIEYVNIKPEEFAIKIQSYTQNLEDLFKESQTLEDEIKKQLLELKYE